MVSGQFKEVKGCAREESHGGRASPLWTSLLAGSLAAGLLFVGGGGGGSQFIGGVGARCTGVLCRLIIRFNANDDLLPAREHLLRWSLARALLDALGNFTGSSMVVLTPAATVSLTVFANVVIVVAVAAALGEAINWAG